MDAPDHSLDATGDRAVVILIAVAKAELFGRGRLLLVRRQVKKVRDAFGLKVPVPRGGVVGDRVHLAHEDVVQGRDHPAQIVRPRVHVDAVWAPVGKLLKEDGCALRVDDELHWEDQSWMCRHTSIMEHYRRSAASIAAI